jgi:hypothetical protein
VFEFQFVVLPSTPAEENVPTVATLTVNDVLHGGPTRPKDALWAIDLETLQAMGEHSHAAAEGKSCRHGHCDT